MVERHAGEIGHGATVVAAADGGSGKAKGVGSFDGLAHGKRSADLTHAVAPIHHETGGAVTHNLGATAGVNTFYRELLHILWHPQHPMRMHTA
jgi:hypothetical protein